jgi:hypothetical protein
VNPVAPTQNDHTELAGADVLLEFKVLVGGQEESEACKNGALDQVTVLETRPTEAANGADERQAELFGQLNWK